ncbi:MAG: adenylate/guanylate cyclase domain-containing protein [Cyanobacteria bacterium P01_C01_bin.118]
MKRWLQLLKTKLKTRLISRKARQQWLYLFVAPGLAAAGMGIGLSLLGFWIPLERGIYNRLFNTRNQLHPLQWDERVVVIAIDDASLATYGSYPWSRSLYSKLLTDLMTVQPAAIGFDILMAEPTIEDTQLGETIRDSGNIVLAVGGDNQGNQVPISPLLLQATDDFARIGHVKHITDSDGVSRQAFLYERHQDTTVESFSIALLQTYQENISRVVNQEQISTVDISAQFLDNSHQEDISIQFLDNLKRFDQHSPAWINWPAPVHTRKGNHNRSQQGVHTVSFQAVMNNDDVLNSLQNKIVLIGYTATGVVGNIEDPLKTPFSRRIPTSGVYIHAALLDNLLNDRFLTALPYRWTLILVILSAFGSGLILRPLNLGGRLLFMVGLAPAWFLVTYSCFVGAGILLPMVAPIGTTLLGMMMFQIAEQRERQALTDLFAISLSPEMADFVWQYKDELLTQGHIHSQELTATLLFTDIRGFTSITEMLPSKTLLAWLNRYFEVMTDCIMAHGGVVDKYIGDAIMAAFGAPVSQNSTAAIQQDALNAVKASMAMVERLKDLNQEFESQELPTVRFGVGLHTGPLVAGTVGSRNRASYSLFGDTVNIAARLQDMTKQLTKNSPYPILMSEATYQLVTEHCTISAEKAKIQLRGRTAQTTVYALSGIKTS